MTDYESFLTEKTKTIQPVGFSVDAAAINPALFDWQSSIVRWALRRGRAALFADCGLGKTPMQLEWAHHVAKQTGGRVLILAPLAVADQTCREGAKFGIEVTHQRRGEDSGAAIVVANYERLHLFRAEDYAGIVLDESSILKSFDGSTRKQIQEFAKSIKYRLACTATPAPNDLIELCNHAEFLDVSSGKEIIALFFKQDGNTTHQWRLKGHARLAFFQWLAQWSVAIRKPSDMGYDDGAFRLPACHWNQHTVEGAVMDGMLFSVEASTLSERRESRHASLASRVATAAALVAAKPNEPWLVWCDFNAESEALTKAIPGAVEVKGSDTPDHKETSLLGFASGSVRVLVSKPTIAGWGMNFQNCSNMVFVGLSDSYEQFYQSVRRCWRFGQKREVNVHVIVSDADGAVVANIQRKERQSAELFDGLVREMSVYEEVNKRQERNTMDYKKDDARGNGWHLMLGDSCERIKEIAENSVGLSVFSPPFPGMYAYTNSARDIGNSSSVDEMLTHFAYMMPDLLRITAPGRNCCIHLMQLTAMKSRDGYIGLKDYRGAVIQAMEDAGWIYSGEVTIDKNPQVQAVRNKDRGLMFKSLAKDASVMRMALADYVLLFRKPGENSTPIHAGISEKYDNAAGWITEEEWIEWAAPVWYRRVDKDGRRNIQGYPGRFQQTDGIMETDVLNVAVARDDNDERHLCPLQLGVIERCVKLWSAPGDTVFSPFAGIGSEGYQAVKLGRKFIGCELKESYWRVACKNIASAEHDTRQPDLLDSACPPPASVL
jgi:superfamily II DNA or RNA helicase